MAMGQSFAPIGATIGQQAEVERLSIPQEFCNDLENGTEHVARIHARLRNAIDTIIGPEPTPATKPPEQTMPPVHRNVAYCANRLFTAITLLEAEVNRLYLR